MPLDSFLDTNVIINYANYQKDRSEEIIAKCYFYVINKKGRFLVCYAVLRELSNIMTKLSVLHKEVLKKIENENYSLKESKYLSKKDVLFAEKLFLTNKELDKNKLKEIFASERDIFGIEIDRFLKSKVDARVIPLDQIKIELVNAFRDIVENYADCQILASALQHQKDNETFLIVTADKKDLNPNNYEYVKSYGILKDYKFPELHNLCFKN